MSTAPDPKDVKARRCAPCNINWPTEKDFVLCPKCEVETDPITFMTPDYDLPRAKRIASGWIGWRMYERKHPSAVPDHA